MSIRDDIRAGLERDPATRSTLELLLTSPGLHAIWIYRLANRIWRARLRIAARMLSNWARFLTGIEIHPGASIGKRLVIDHGMSVVIGETAVIGDDCLLYHEVTLGGKTLDPVKRHPTLGNRVTVGAGAKIIGAITIGDDAKIGSNAVVTRDVSPGQVIVGENRVLTRQRDR